jgi:hypothetical protein
MATVTVPRADLTSAEVVTVLRGGLGPDYNVLPGMAVVALASSRGGRWRPGSRTETHTPIDEPESAGLPSVQLNNKLSY